MKSPLLSLQLSDILNNTLTVGDALLGNITFLIFFFCFRCVTRYVAVSGSLLCIQDQVSKQKDTAQQCLMLF